MSIEIINLTQKGESLSHSVRQSNAPEWRVINYLHKMGGRSTRDKIQMYCCGNDFGVTSSVIRNLKTKGIVTGE
jgi:hypothetical protein